MLLPLVIRGLFLRGLLLRGSSLTHSQSTGHWWLGFRSHPISMPHSLWHRFPSDQINCLLMDGEALIIPTSINPTCIKPNTYLNQPLSNQPLLNQGQHLSLRRVGATSKPQRLAGSVDHVDHDIFRHSPPRQCLARSTVPSLGIVAQDTSAARRRWCPSIQPTESHLRRYLGYPRVAPPPLRFGSILNGF